MSILNGERFTDRESDYYANLLSLLNSRQSWMPCRIYALNVYSKREDHRKRILRFCYVYKSRSSRDTPGRYTASRLRGGMPGFCHKYAHILKKWKRPEFLCREFVLSVEVMSYGRHVEDLVSRNSDLKLKFICVKKLILSASSHKEQWWLIGIGITCGIGLIFFRKHIR
jgi:hypothetical protein